MKKLLLLASVALLICGCSKEYDDSKLNGRIDSLEQRLSAMETVMRAYENNLFIQSVQAIDDGYIITFSDGSKATITNGKNGQNGTDGKDGKDGVDGTNGKDGADGDSMFSNVDTSDPNYVVFTLSDGSQIKLPTWAAFEALQRLCNQTNTNLNSLTTIVEALEKSDYITSVDPLTENGSVVGYTIKFAKSNPIVIYNGRDGVSGTTPEIGIKQDTDGCYYWTLNGEFMVVDGQKVRAQGKDGANGTDGTNGTTPKLKIEEGYWWISYNDGSDWTKLDKAIGENGKDADSIKVTQDENNVYIELPDGTIITIHKSGAQNSDSDIIHFDDVNVKAICLKNWDTNHDGELSYEEAAAVTSIGTVFAKNEDIQIFNEFQYFINVTELEGSFYSCSNLCHIIFPNSIIKIGDNTFTSCSSLYDISLPKNLKMIGDKAFASSYRNGDLLIIPKSVQSIGENAFSSFRGQKIEFEDQSELTTLGKSAFLGADITEICLPAKLTTIPYAAFYLCQQLTKVSFESGSLLTSIRTKEGSVMHGFGNCGVLTEFDASNCVYLSEIEQHAFADDSTGPFRDTWITVFKIGALTPPKCPSSSTFNITSSAVLYVPKESIELYKNHSGWNKFKTILPLEDLEE